MNVTSSVQPIPAVIGVVLRKQEVLLVRRANPPDAGRWGLPGGKIEAGETILEAAVREVHEETAISVSPRNIFTALEAFDHGLEGELRQHFVLIAVLCEWLQGEPVAGDDALDAQWVNLIELERQNLVMSFGVRSVVRRAEELTSAHTRQPSQ